MWFSGFRRINLYQLFGGACLLLLAGLWYFKGFQRIKLYQLFGGAFLLLLATLWYYKDDWSSFDFEGRQHDDPALIKFIRHIMVYPPADPLPYNLVHPEETDYSMHGQGPQLRKIFGVKRDGYFIEAGGFTGEEYSPTLSWERDNNWTGIIVEPHPYYYALISGKNRRAIILNAGLSPTNTANTLTFTNDGWGSRIANETVRKSLPKSKLFTVPCFPLTSILAVVGTPTVDLLSLDVEGAELDILRTLDFSVLDIRVVMFEYFRAERYSQIQKLLQRNGFRQWARLEYDGIFVKKK